MVAGTIIGASIFVQPSEIARHLETPTEIMLVWAACGVLTLFGALVCAELTSAFPRTGGVYVFLKEAYSPAIGFLWGWAMFWSMHTGIMAAIATVFARYTGYFFPMGDGATRGVAVAAILALSLVNYLGVRFGSGVQTALTAVKVAGVFVIILLGFLLNSGAAATATAPGRRWIECTPGMALTSASLKPGPPGSPRCR